MSEDFNLIEKTLNDIHEAIKDIGLLDRRARNEKEDHFVHRLTDIFISLFDFCYFSTKMFELSRKRMFIDSVIYRHNLIFCSRSLHQSSFQRTKRENSGEVR
jgi:hypothetical protein